MAVVNGLSTDKVQKSLYRSERGEHSTGGFMCMGNDNNELKWADLDKDEQEFLRAWHAADAETRANVFALLLNHQRRHHADDGGQVIPFPSTPRDDG